MEARDAWLADAANRAGHGTAGGGDLQLGAASAAAAASPYQVSHGVAVKNSGALVMVVC